MGNKISVVFTEDIITFVKLLKVQRFNDNQIGYDNYGLYPESHLFDFMAMVLGLQDHRIPGTEDNPLGAEYDEETTERLHNIDALPGTAVNLPPNSIGFLPFTQSETS